MTGQPHEVRLLIDRRSWGPRYPGIIQRSPASKFKGRFPTLTWSICVRATPSYPGFSRLGLKTDLHRFDRFTPKRPIWGHVTHVTSAPVLRRRVLIPSVNSPMALSCHLCPSHGDVNPS